MRPVGHFGPMLGAWADAHWTAERVELEPGDTLVAFSDGVTDTVGADGRFGEERLLAALRGVGAPRRRRGDDRRGAERLPARRARPTTRPVLALDIPTT